MRTLGTEIKSGQLLLRSLAATCLAQNPSTSVSKPGRDTYLKLAAEVDGALHDDVLGVWAG